MYTVNLVIKKGFTHKDGTTPIYLQYNFSRDSRRIIQTGKKINPENWDRDSERPKRKVDGYQELNNYLYMLKRKLERVIDEAIIKGVSPTMDYIEKHFYQECGTTSPKELNFISALNELIERKKSQVSKDVIKDYNSLRKHLLGYQEHYSLKLTFTMMDFDFYEKFVHYLEFIAVKPNGEVGMQKNTVGKLIKNLKSFLHDCARRKIIEPVDMSGFKSTQILVDDVYLTEEELIMIEHLDLIDQPELDKIRDLFLIGCETGLRFSDFNRLDWHYIQGNFIRMKVKKTTTNVIIPISERVRRIISKYQAPNFPSGLCMIQFNKLIKGIVKDAGINTKFSKWKIIGNQKIEVTKMKFEFVSSHTCRRTFCTNQFLRGMPTILIRKISGHKDESAFLRYIKIDEEEAAQKMLDMWGN